MALALEKYTRFRLRKKVNFIVPEWLQIINLCQNPAEKLGAI